MLEKHLTTLFEELNLGAVPPFEKDGTVQVQVGAFPIQIRKIEPDVYISARIAPLPKKDKEEFLLTLMKANFLGQGTGGSVLGLKEDESFLTLSFSLPYEVNYRAFKDAIEEFINYVDYWKTETARYEAE